ncbi:MAG: mechanosensitive ion channel protein MscS [Candidatus Fluviicola riflensis]|nr:MAG: mechanosensitive ion channel protein MscS [Candidatus Fluviicola riflensis]
MLLIEQAANAAKDTGDFFGFSWTEAQQFIVRSGSNLLIAVIILVVGWWLAGWSGKAIRKILTKSKTDAGLVTFLSSLATISLKILVIITTVTQLGVQMTSFVAILGAAGLAIGMAFSGTLSNFAGGVMILLFKPFKVGDTILTQTHQGKVVEIQIFYTYLHTSDNKVVILPNGLVANASMINFTKEKKRRVDWTISLAHGEDYVKAHTVILQYLKDDQRVLKEPVPFIALAAITADSIDITVRAWAKTDDFWKVYFDLNKRVYEEFEQAGLSLAISADAKKTSKATK